MIFSDSQLFCHNQEVRADGDISEKVIDLGVMGRPVYGAADLVGDPGPGNPVPITVTVTEDFDQPLTVVVVTAEDETLTTGAEDVISFDIQNVDDKAPLLRLPRGIVKRYLGLRFEAGTAPTSGTIWAGISGGTSTNIHGV